MAQLQQGKGLFCSQQHPGRLWGVPSLPSNPNRGLVPGVKWPGHEADHSPPSSAEVKNVHLHLYSSISLHYLIKHRDKFTYTAGLYCTTVYIIVSFIFYICIYVTDSISMYVDFWKIH
jgi:hypothetical protein